MLTTDITGYAQNAKTMQVLGASAFGDTEVFLLQQILLASAVGGANPTPPSPITLWVDSVGGSDTNSGRSISAPKQTLAAALAIAGSNEFIGLKCGSFWRESLNLSNLTAPSVLPYGSGDPPRISGLNVVTGWSLVGGTTNVWTASVSHDSSQSSRMRVFENGVELARVLDQATCDSTAGSFVIQVGSDGTPWPCRIHPSDNGNPNSNGKKYEVTVRTIVVQGPVNCSISGVETDSALDNNGSVDLVSRTGGTLSSIIAANGSKHNWGMGDGTASDCFAYLADTVTAAEPSNTTIVAYLDDARGKTWVVKRCGVAGVCPGVDSDAHGINPNNFASTTAEQIWVINTGYFAGSWTNNTGSLYRGVLGPPVALGTLRMVIADILANHTPAGLSNYGNTFMTDCCILKQQSVNYNAVLQAAANTSTLLQCSNFCNTSLSAGNPTVWFNNNSASAVVSVNKSVFFYGYLHAQIPVGATYTGDYNVYVAGIPGDTTTLVSFQWHGTNIYTLAAWQAASGQDTHSVYLLRADQTSGNGNAFWLGIALGLNNGPADGDWRVNPNARTYDGSNTARIGYFADGTTPITQAGAQNHWDWNARASTSGAPTRFPTVPVDLPTARVYVKSPATWNFYP